MWWEKKSQPEEPQSPNPLMSPPTLPKMENPMTQIPAKQAYPAATGPQQTILGRTVIMKGQLSGNGDLLIEGQFEGNIALEDHTLTVGPDGQVKAEVHARQVVIQGAVTGNISARDKIEIRRTGHVLGDLRAAGVAIEDGAYFKGSIEIVREEAQEASKAMSASSALGKDD